MNHEIDAVVTWVDGNDSAWLKKKHDYQGVYQQSANDFTCRYRDFGTLKYVLRSLDLYAPWLNQIFLITDQQIPAWLTKKQSKLHLVDHRDYIEEQYLPTFNSNVIELNLGNLAELNENFILFNDDMFLNGAVKPQDFFINNLPRDAAILSPICPELDGIESMMANNLKLINSAFTQRSVAKQHLGQFFNWRYGIDNLRTLFLLPYTKFSGFLDYHVPLALKKSVLQELTERFRPQFRTTYQHHIRSNEDLTIWLVRYWQLCTGQFRPRRTSFGKYVPLTKIAQIEQILETKRYKAVCLNDVPMSDQQVQKVCRELPRLLETKFPQKSQFEW